MDSDYQRLVEDAYASAVNPALLGDWTIAASRWVGGRTAAVSMIDRERRALLVHHIAHPDPSQLEDYVREGMHLIDPLLVPVLSLRSSTLFRSGEVIDRTQPDTRRYMAFQNDRSRIDHSATAAIMLDGGRHLAALTIHNAVGDGEIDDKQRRRMQALAPTLGRALSMAAAHGHKLSAAWWDGRLAAASEPTALLDARGRILKATPEMVERLRRADGLREASGRLAALDPASDTALRKALAGAAVARAAGSRDRVPATATATAVRIARANDLPPLIVTLWPLVPPVQHMLPEPAAILATLVDPSEAPVPRAQLWRAIFGLTGREADVAALLVAGQSPEMAATTLGVALSTLRIHLRRLMAKTDTHRQTDLVRLLGRLS